MKKMFCTFLLFPIVFLFTGCNRTNTIPYNAKLIDGGFTEGIYDNKLNEKFKESFLQENKVSGASYYNDNYNPSDPYSEKYIYDSTSPKEIIIVIDSKEKHDQIFNCEHDIDYDNEILILRLFADTSCSYWLNDVILENGVLTIIFNYKINSTTAPMRRFSMVKIDKIEYETIKFFYKRVKK
ncbi:MAG: hypothetical protein J6W25_05420 [Bacilli bacterium]|nr:hypothetical protein [Bacilli bacterium]MBO7536685.1 hypothetical protein [Bacilli bacterium]